MKYTALALALLSSTLAFAQGYGSRATAPDAVRHPPVPKTENEKRILATIDDAVRANELYENVPAADGRMLRLLAESTGAKQVIEIGTSTGISGLWFSLALDRTGGHLTTFEIDRGRAAIAAGHFKKAGVDRLITIVQGDAHQNLKTVKGPVDIVFIDADKSGYVDYLDRMLPLLRPGGLILAHNVEMVPDYVRAVTTNPDLDTVFYMQGAGLAITLKKR